MPLSAPRLACAYPAVGRYPTRFPRHKSYKFRAHPLKFLHQHLTKRTEGLLWLGYQVGEEGALTAREGTGRPASQRGVAIHRARAKRGMIGSPQPSQPDLAALLLCHHLRLPLLTPAGFFFMLLLVLLPPPHQVLPKLLFAVALNVVVLYLNLRYPDSSWYHLKSDIQKFHSRTYQLGHHTRPG